VNLNWVINISRHPFQNHCNSFLSPHTSRSRSSSVLPRPWRPPSCTRPWRSRRRWRRRPGNGRHPRRLVPRSHAAREPEREVGLFVGEQGADGRVEVEGHVPRRARSDAGPELRLLPGGDGPWAARVLGSHDAWELCVIRRRATVCLASRTVLSARRSAMDPSPRRRRMDCSSRAPYRWGICGAWASSSMALLSESGGWCVRNGRIWCDALSAHRVQAIWYARWGRR
jgi:hypothetical protein